MAHEKTEIDFISGEYNATTQQKIAACSLHQHSLFAIHNFHCHQSLLGLDQASVLRLTETLQQASVQMADQHKQARQHLFSSFLHSSVPLLAEAEMISRASIVSEFKTRSYKRLGPDHISTNKKDLPWIIKSHSCHLPFCLRWQEVGRLNGDLVAP